MCVCVCVCVCVHVCTERERVGCNKQRSNIQQFPLVLFSLLRALYLFIFFFLFEAKFVQILKIANRSSALAMRKIRNIFDHL